LYSIAYQKVEPGYNEKWSPLGLTHSKRATLIGRSPYNKAAPFSFA